MNGSRLRAVDRLWTLQFQRRLWSKLTIGMEIAEAIADPGQSPLVGYIFVLPPPEPEAITIITFQQGAPWLRCTNLE